MQFNTLIFIFLYMPVAILLIRILPKKFKRVALLIFSLLFYLLSDINYFILLLFIILFTYLIGLIIDHKYKKLIYIAYIIVMVVILSIFKYPELVIDTFKNILESFSIYDLVMPLGISFYIFTSISYVSDIYYGKIEKEKSLFNIANYIAFFPTVISGPILRYADFKKEIENLGEDSDNLAIGLRRFIIGLFKKVVIADNIAVFTSFAFSESVELSWFVALLGMGGFYLQLYYDFSSYSDMAIALAKMLNMNLKENFKDPYMSTNLKDFWRRWHISLGSWFKDYVYIPLGGSRVGLVRWVINMLIVWGLTGIWHGSSVNYLVWGLYNGLILIVEKAIYKYIKIPKVIGWILTQIVVMFGFLIFNVTSLEQLSQFINALMNNGASLSLIYLQKMDVLYTLPYILLGLIFIFPITYNIGKFMDEKLPYFYDIVLVIMLGVSVIFMISGSYSSFIYFGF